MDIELLAQVADVGLQHARVAAEVIAPYVVEQLRPGQDPSRIQQQVAQEPVLGGGELDRMRAAVDLAGVLVELEVGEAQAARGLLEGSAAPQEVAQPGDQTRRLGALGRGRWVRDQRGGCTSGGCTSGGGSVSRVTLRYVSCARTSLPNFMYARAMNRRCCCRAR